MRGAFVAGFLSAKFGRPAEIHKQIVAVYGNVMNRQNVTKWCREFFEGRTDVHEEQRSCRTPLFSDEILHEIEGEIRANRRVTVRVLHHIIPKVSKSTIHEAVTDKLRDRKFAHAGCPNINRRSQNETYRFSTEVFHVLLKEIYEILDSILTGDERYVLHENPENSTTMMKSRKKS
jgi:hypothetical protein